MGFGHGWRHGYYATGLPGWAPGYAYSYPYPGPIPTVSGGTATAKGEQAEELAFLKDQARYFTEALEDINKRVEELRKKTEKKPEK